MEKNLVKKAEELYRINNEMKALAERADHLKAELRRELLDGAMVQFQDGEDTVVCKKAITTTPVLDNKKLYAKMTAEELATATKPVLAEIKKIFADEYDDVVEATLKKWTMMEQIRFCVKK